MPKQSVFIQRMRLAKFVAFGYKNPADVTGMARILPALFEDWDATMAVAYENRILTNIIALIVENDTLLTMLKDDQKLQIKIMYMDHWRANELIKQQLMDLSETIAAKTNANVLMIKGGLRVFDDLYPSMAHRYMSDIDLYFEDVSILKALAAAGYYFKQDSLLDLSKFSQDDMNEQHLRNHHLAPVFHDDYQRCIELHQSLVHLRAAKYCRKDTFDLAMREPKLKAVLNPTPMDQMIINLLHTTYGDKFTYYSKYRLRNIFEGYLLYQKLSDADKDAFENHFEQLGLSADVVFWKYLCSRMFDAQEFSFQPDLYTRTRYWLHSKFGHSPRVNAGLYSVYFMHRLLFRELRTKQDRQELWSRIIDPKKRREFFKRIGRSWHG